MEARRIQQVGKRSYSISLPKAWIEEQKLKPQDTIFFEKTINNELLLRSKNEGKQQLVSIEASISDVGDVEEFLTLCYIKNIHQVKLTSKKFEISSIRRVKKILKKLEGYDITSESATVIEITFLFQSINVGIQQIMARMLYLLKVMLESIEKKDLEALDEVEATEDKLYNMAKRILSRALLDSKLRIDNGLQNTDELMYLWDTFKKVETIADDLGKLKTVNCSSKDIESIKVILDYAQNAWYKKSESISMIEKLKEMTFTSTDDGKQALLKMIHKHCTEVIRNMVYTLMDRKYFQGK